MTDAALQECPLSEWSGDQGRCRWCNKKLRGRQQRWCSDACPKAMLANHCWGDARTAALDRDGRCCTDCGSADNLHVHHAAEAALGRHRESSCVHHLAGLRTLCFDCHMGEHERLRRRGPEPRDEQLSLDDWGGFGFTYRNGMTAREAFAEANRDERAA